MTHFKDTVANVIEETFRRYPTVALSDGLQSIAFCLGTLFTDNHRTESAIARALVDTGLAKSESDGRNTMLEMLTAEHGLRTCSDAQDMLGKIGIHITGAGVEEPTRYSNSLRDNQSEMEYQCAILEEVAHFHHIEFEKLLEGEYVTEDGRQAFAYLLDLTCKLNRDMAPALFYQFVQGMTDETCVQ